MNTLATNAAVAPSPFGSALSLSRTLPQGRFALGWAVAWALVGCAVATGIVYSTDVDFWPAFRVSVLFAEVVGFTALLSARLVFPLLVKLPYLLFLLLQILTLLSVTIFGSVAVIRFELLFSLARPRTVALIVLVNAVIAVVVGIALHTYDSMRRQIEESFRVLREKEVLDRELSIARDVQQELLPRSAPDVLGLQLSGVCVPAVGVGGDYYDFVPMRADQVGLVIADVSGKGVPAALLMAGLQASVRSMILPDVRPSDITRRLNEILYRSSSAARYATFFFGSYDGSARTFRYSNAGHYPPLLVNEHEVVRLDTASGRPIGMFDDSAYSDGSHTLTPGDLLALFTDGVVETPGPGGEEFGERRLAELLRQHRERPLDTIVRTVLDELERWSGGAEAHDDVTLVLARAR